MGSGDIVAEATWAREHIFLDVARTLNISPDAADKLIHCQAGDKLPAGVGCCTGDADFCRRSVKSPREGRVVAAGGGQVLIESGEVAYGTACRHSGQCHADHP